ncbi:MAG: GNAT family N-acetyltransferase [Cellulosilyticaceae bacterium]
MEYRELRLEEAERIGEINAEQMIERAWREVDGVRQLVAINWLERELPNGLEWHIARLKDSLANGGKAYGCFEEERLIGYVVIDGKLFGKAAHYILLDQLFISLEYRGQGVGSALFRLCCEAAEHMKADKIYICAGSAEETIAFYFAIGCKKAEEVNQALYEGDPRDYQLEYILS